MAENGAVAITDDRERGTLTAHEDGTAAGTIAYFVMEPAPGALVAVHTVVRPEHVGKGIAGALVRKFYAMAAQEGVSVVPLCPYAAKWAQRHPDEAPAAPEKLVREAERHSRTTPSCSEGRRTPGALGRPPPHAVSAPCRHRRQGEDRDDHPQPAPHVTPGRNCVRTVSVCPGDLQLPQQDVRVGHLGRAGTRTPSRVVRVDSTGAGSRTGRRWRKAPSVRFVLLWRIE